MSRTVHVVDYGVGNLLSVARAMEKVGATVCLTDDPATIAQADHLILPGVGSFRDGMAGLVARGLDDAVRRHAQAERPLLGICLGMQLLASESLEFGRHAGLDLIPGLVQPIPSTNNEGRPHKVPFVGWTELEPTRQDAFHVTPLAGLGRDDAVYLVHSYQMVPEASTALLAVYHYNGVQIAAAVKQDNVLGCQFHPEKSGPVGLDILRRFIAA